MRVIESSLVAGKSKEMTAVVHELMNGTAMNERGRSLLGADKVNGQQHQETGENRPW
jgi:hypothetical protein